MVEDDEDPQERALWLIEAILEFTTIAGLFALLFALFVLCGVAQAPSP